ncbi:hypothetical protein SAMN05428985_106112 [Nocardioides sp. YR527]|uniref:hypothetical protein n=1 Tax=Nocardioides sp. YR527 TaxID=1881028 RepID=UPI000881317D|nr:hypothetical protein [Nocardioides sp. YR527]SDK79582.1 hypothetical protein SAMN05428985_106112 [Nocardioides sp. YR527]
MELRARTIWLIGIGSLLAFVAMMVGIAVAISWEIAPRVYSVDPAVEQQVMKDLEPWSDRWRVESEGLIEGDEYVPSRMEAVLARGSGDDQVRLELTTEGWEYGAVLTLPHARKACRVDVDWP